MNFSYINRSLELYPEENRLLRQARSGDTSAFVQLYDTYVERVYRYIHFLVPNIRVAEGLTFQTFFKAWQQLDRYQVFGSSFVAWLYSVAQNQVAAYYRTHKKTIAPENDFILAARGGDYSREFQTIREGLQFLTTEQQQVLILKFVAGMPNKNISRVMARREGDIRVLQMHALQTLTESLNEIEIKINMPGFQRILEECLMKLANGASTLDNCLTRYPMYAAQLKPLLKTALLLSLGRDVKPMPTFNAYTRTALVQYVGTHPRQPRIIITPAFQRTALAFTVMVALLVATGTAQAQSALPGETLYSWKRASEEVWRTFSLNPVATNIILTERRADELIAVVDDPAQMAIAMQSYLEALARLETNDAATLTTIVLPALVAQQQTLQDAGLSTSELDDYLIELAVLPIVLPTEIPATATDIPPTATDIPPTATDIPSTATHVPPTATDIPPTATDVPPTATDVPPTATEVPPTATDVPTEPPATVDPDATPTDGLD
ncbi:MAG: sigma-70 family RNA polymerase sigma factor [Anaerolineales bacterium]|nr:sigma-70 family RNA polymerase sigma factor [Anaerolineales bacterium]